MAQPKDFGYGIEEQLLRTEARKFFKNNCDELTLMDLVAKDSDPDRDPECLWDKKLWKKMAKLGWTTLAVPEDAGGIGMSAVSVATMIEETGRAAFPSPMLASANATYVLAACGTPNAKAALEEIAEDKTASLAVTNKQGSWETSDTDVTASSSGNSISLNGTAWFVQDARKGSVAIDAATPAMLVMVSADMCGAAEWQLQTTVEYAKQRVQFDHPIGFFQAVKHPIVNMMIMIDTARSNLYNAACAIDHEPEASTLNAHMAKASASDMAAFCSGRSVQYHGGMGFTWESFVHLYFKRQIHNQVLYGDAAYHRAKLADIMIGPLAA